MAVKICLNRARGTMTSANWKVIDRPCQQSGLRRFSVPFSRTGLLPCKITRAGLPTLVGAVMRSVPGGHEAELQGLIISTPHPSKSGTLRVASAAPRDRAIAAI